MEVTMIDIYILVFIEVVTLVWIFTKFYAREYIKNQVKYGFDVELETHKADLQQELKDHEQKLQVITEEAKLDITRRTQDFNLYTQKRHKSYIKIHQSITEAQSRLFGLRGLVTGLDYSQFSYDEIKEWLEKNKFGDNDKESVLNIWDTNRAKATRLVWDLNYLLSKHNTNKSIGKAQNLFVENQLYMSKTAIEVTGELLNKMRILYINYNFQYMDDKKAAEEEELRKAIPDLLEKITLIMREELKKGYYPEID